MDEEREKIREECDRFLKTYNPDSSVRVSKEAFQRIFSMACKLSVGINPYTHNPPHPIVNIIYVRQDEIGLLLIIAEMRTGKFHTVQETNENIRKVMRKLPTKLPEDVRRTLASLTLINPIPVTLEDIGKLGVRPFDLIKTLKESFDRDDFSQAVAHSTQPFAEA